MGPGAISVDPSLGTMIFGFYVDFGKSFFEEITLILEGFSLKEGNQGSGNTL